MKRILAASEDGWTGSNWTTWTLESARILEMNIVEVWSDWPYNAQIAGRRTFLFR
jgi:hypothetical protein